MLIHVHVNRRVMHTMYLGVVYAGELHPSAITSYQSANLAFLTTQIPRMQLKAGTHSMENIQGWPI